MSLPSVTIIGGTGTLGQKISNAFVTDFRSSFSRVRVLTRDPESDKAKDLASKGVELVKLGDDKAFDEAFEGTDVIVNALPGTTPEATLNAILQAITRSSAKVYFLGEFGSDHRVNDFPGFDAPQWLEKQKVEQEVRSAFKGKVIAVYTSLFLEVCLFIPILGINLRANTYTAYGSASTRASWISLADVGRVVARLAILSTNEATAALVPDHVRVSGSTASFEDIRDTVARVKGLPPAEVKTEDLAAKKEALKTPGVSFLEYLRVVVGEGKADHGSNNDNELVNPGQEFWKWTTVEDILRAQ